MTFYGGAELILWCANLHKILGAMVNDNKALFPEIKFHKFLITALWYSQFNRNLGQIALLDCKRFSFRVLSLSTLVVFSQTIFMLWKITRNWSNKKFIKYFFFVLFKLQQFSTRFIKEKNNCFLRKSVRSKSHSPASVKFVIDTRSLYLGATVMWGGGGLSITFEKIYGSTYQWRKIPRANEKKVRFLRKALSKKRKMLSNIQKAFSNKTKVLQRGLVLKGIHFKRL